jgi:hypothetical protein
MLTHSNNYAHSRDLRWTLPNIAPATDDTGSIP